jgi:hypothetical protein
MKPIIIIAMLLTPVWCFGQTDVIDMDNFSLSASSTISALFFQPATHNFILYPDTGEITLDGKQIQELSSQEIKDILKEIAKSLLASSNESWYSRQTDYLLEALEQCNKIKDDLLSIADRQQILLNKYEKNRKAVYDGLTDIQGRIEKNNDALQKAMKKNR